MADSNSTSAHIQNQRAYDFYVFFVRDSCKGIYNSGYSGNRTRKDRNIISCSGEDIEMDILQDLIPPNIIETLSPFADQLHLGLAPLKLTKKAIHAFYILAVIASSISLICAMSAVVFKRRVGTISSVMTDWVTSIMITIACVMTTTIELLVISFMDHLQGRTGVMAIRGDRFLTLTWAAAGLMITVSVIRCLSCVLRII